MARDEESCHGFHCEHHAIIDMGGKNGSKREDNDEQDGKVAETHKTREVQRGEEEKEGGKGKKWKEDYIHVHSVYANHVVLTAEDLNSFTFISTWC